MSQVGSQGSGISKISQLTSIFEQPNQIPPVKNASKINEKISKFEQQTHPKKPHFAKNNSKPVGQTQPIASKSKTLPVAKTLDTKYDYPPNTSKNNLTLPKAQTKASPESIYSSNEFQQIAQDAKAGRQVGQEFAQKEEYYKICLDSICDIFLPEFFNILADQKSSNLEISSKTIQNIQFVEDHKSPGFVTNSSATSEKSIQLITNLSHLKTIYKITPIFQGFMREIGKIVVTIRILHGDFYTSLQESFETNRIGDAFKNKLDYLQIYSDYLILYKKFQDLGGFPIFIHTNKLIEKMCEKVIVNCIQTYPEYFGNAASNNLQQLGIQELFTNIFQKLVRYELLLKEYIKQLSKRSKASKRLLHDQKLAQQVLDMIQEINQTNNQNMESKQAMILVTRTQIINPISAEEIENNITMRAMDSQPNFGSVSSYSRVGKVIGHFEPNKYFKFYTTTIGLSFYIKVQPSVNLDKIQLSQTKKKI